MNYKSDDDYHLISYYHYVYYNYYGDDDYNKYANYDENKRNKTIKIFTNIKTSIKKQKK